MTSTPSYSDFFKDVSGTRSPHAWQGLLADQTVCTNRLIPVGTGLGKTFGIAGAWAYHRLVRDDVAWPRRLVWCLPMRVLVEQTADELSKILDKTVDSFLPDQTSIPVHVLMGGVETEQWHLQPDRPTVLVGTQDMLLSRALNRGYASARGRWPMEFALLNSDCLWVFDEVQLMGVGAVTGSQLQAFRGSEHLQGRMMRPSYTWWASATLRQRWLKSVDSEAMLQSADKAKIQVPEQDHALPVYQAQKPVSVKEISGKLEKAALRQFVDLIASSHLGSKPEKTDNQEAPPGHVTLVVVNRVDEACLLHRTLEEREDLDDVDVQLIHSRFRGIERQAWRTSDQQDAVLSKSACQNPATNRIIVSTQVVEAGVDISASCLISELAPWSSLVQRFGRAARYGGHASIVIVDRQLTAKKTLPYQEDELAASRTALAQLKQVDLNTLEKSDQQWQQDTAFDADLFRLDYLHLLLPQDLDDLFDTSPDLTGDDIDISRFIRQANENSVQICWFDSGEPEKNAWEPPANFAPQRDSLCPAPMTEVRDWLLDSKQAKVLRDRFRNPAFSWSFDEGCWRPLTIDQMRPGIIILVDARCGGYTVEHGFLGARHKLPKQYEGVPNAVGFQTDLQASPTIGNETASDYSQQRDLASQTAAQYVSIADHGAQVAQRALQLASEIGIDPTLHTVLETAGRWHDYGKGHPVFRGNIRPESSPWDQRNDIAKAPNNAWLSYRSSKYNWPEEIDDRYREAPMGRRTGFRHELASMLGVLQLAANCDPPHPALADSDDSLVTFFEPAFGSPEPEPAIRDDLFRFAVGPFNLLLYLIAAHHGKVRGGLHMTPDDQEYRPPALTASSRQDNALAMEQTATAVEAAAGVATIARETLPIRGVRTGDVLPSIEIAVGDGTRTKTPEVRLCTEIASMGWSPGYGDSWTARTIALRQRYGIFDLAILEAVLRAADIQISSA